MNTPISLLFTIALSSPAFAKEGEAAWLLSDDTELRYWRISDRLSDFPDQPILNYVEQINRFTVTRSEKNTLLFVQVDEVSLWANRYVLDGALYTERPLRNDALGVGLFNSEGPLGSSVYANVEKFAITFNRSGNQYIIGDFYNSFGWGGAMSLSRKVDVDIDTSIRGLKGVVQSGPWEVKAVVGVLNRQTVWQDNPNKGLRPDRPHGVFGAGLTHFGAATVELHTVLYDFVQSSGLAGLSELGSIDAWVSGTSVEASVSGVDLTVESNTYFYPQSGQAGLGTYLAAVSYPGDLILHLEGKAYQRAEQLNKPVAPGLFEVATGPTLEYERVITEDSSATLNSNDIVGAKLWIEAVRPFGIPSFSVGLFRDRQLGGIHFNTVPETVVHPILGYEFRGDEWIVVINSGLRMDFRDQWRETSHQNKCGGGDLDRQYHSDVDFKFPIFGPIKGDWAVAIERFCWGKNALQQSDYTEMESAFTLEFAPGLFLISYLDYSDNPLILSTGNLNDVFYGAFELQYEPKEGTTIKTFWGAYKGGIRCSGGQCRQLPGFSGARVAVVTNF